MLRPVCYGHHFDLALLLNLTLSRTFLFHSFQWTIWTYSVFHIRCLLRILRNYWVSSWDIFQLTASFFFSQIWMHCSIDLVWIMRGRYLSELWLLYVVWVYWYYDFLSQVKLMSEYKGVLPKVVLQVRQVMFFILQFCI